eukprot:6695401-Pyramimonas_sp.AAC.1
MGHARAPHGEDETGPAPRPDRAEGRGDAAREPPGDCQFNGRVHFRRIHRVLGRQQGGGGHRQGRRRTLRHCRIQGAPATPPPPRDR